MTEENVMRNIRISKLVLNIGVGEVCPHPWNVTVTAVGGSSYSCRQGP